jgi:hypothetical protein
LLFTDLRQYFGQTLFEDSGKPVEDAIQALMSNEWIIRSLHRLQLQGVTVADFVVRLLSTVRKLVSCAC